MQNLAKAGGGNFNEINGVLELPILLVETLRSWKLLD
jgi:hypothetical protein